MTDSTAITTQTLTVTKLTWNDFQRCFSSVSASSDSRILTVLLISIMPDTKIRPNKCHKCHFLCLCENVMCCVPVLRGGFGS